MRQLLISTAAVAIVAATSFGAVAFETRSVLIAVDPAANTITLDNGVVLEMMPDFDVSALPVGQLVEVDYNPATREVQYLDVVTNNRVFEADPRGGND